MNWCRVERRFHESTTLLMIQKVSHFSYNGNYEDMVICTRKLENDSLSLKSQKPTKYAKIDLLQRTKAKLLYLFALQLVSNVNNQILNK